MNHQVIRDPVQDTVIYPEHHIALKDPLCQVRIYQLTADAKSEPFAEAHILRSEREARPLLRLFGYTGEFQEFDNKKVATMTPLFSMLSVVRGYMSSSPEAVTLEMTDRFRILCNMGFQNCELTNCSIESLAGYANRMSQFVEVLEIHMRRELSG